MVSVRDAIRQRRSIRKFRPDPVPQACVDALLEAARQAPSGCNAQPWRFKTVIDEETRQGLSRAAFGQSFIAEAPLVIVCCADVQGYLDGTVSGTQDLGKIGAIEERVVEIILKRSEGQRRMSVDELGPTLALNVAIAVEHMVLTAAELGLGTCWVRLIDQEKIKEIFGWGETVYVVALLPVGYADESPEARKRRDVKEILVD
ncbi:MAG TPA: nitroreductase family protein [Syntrophorhabdaceae bacterium]|jgi:nitroreductase